MIDVGYLTEVKSVWLTCYYHRVTNPLLLIAISIGGGGCWYLTYKNEGKAIKILGKYYPLYDLGIVFSEHVILSWISHLPSTFRLPLTLFHSWLNKRWEFWDKIACALKTIFKPFKGLIPDCFTSHHTVLYYLVLCISSWSLIICGIL